MVLAEKPPAWLAWKHLIISSETFQKKKKPEYNARAKAEQTDKGLQRN